MRTTGACGRRQPLTRLLLSCCNDTVVGCLCRNALLSSIYPNFPSNFFLLNSFTEGCHKPKPLGMPSSLFPILFATETSNQNVLNLQLHFVDQLPPPPPVDLSGGCQKFVVCSMPAADFDVLFYKTKSPVETSTFIKRGGLRDPVTLKLSYLHMFSHFRPSFRIHSGFVWGCLRPLRMWQMEGNKRNVTTIWQFVSTSTPLCHSSLTVN